MNTLTAHFWKILTLAALLPLLAGCGSSSGGDEAISMDQRLGQYTTYRLTADLEGLSGDQRQMISLLIDAAKAMDEVFWMQAWGDRGELMERIDDPKARRFAEINYGPWDRLNNNEPFVEDVGAKPAGANFYPADMTREEFEAWDSDAKDDLYTLVRRDSAGNLATVSYREAYREQHERAAAKLKEASLLARNPGLQRYLDLRANALLTGEYRESDLAWMDMKTNTIEVVIGPIETYEDQLFGYKAAHEAFVLIKDTEWSDRLSRYTDVLPDLQEGLPVPEEYKRESPGTESDLNAYDAVYYAGDANAGSKTIAINLPNDEQVQLEKGTRRLQLKNAMRAKYDRILVPIAEALIAEGQRSHITFEAFFANTMFHEVAHGLGIKNTITGSGTVREALRDHASALEEGKADVLGLYMISELRESGMVTEGSLEDNYVTFLASIFRSIRFGQSSAHGKANLIRFNYFRKHGAFTYDESAGTYSVDFGRMEEAVDSLSREILTLQGDGDYGAVDAFVEKYLEVGERLRGQLEMLDRREIPRDVVFEQGKPVLGL